MAATVTPEARREDRLRRARRSSAPSRVADHARRHVRGARRRLARPRRARRRSSRTSTASQLKGEDVGKIKTVGDADRPGGEPRGMNREVVITGVGAVTPLGVGARTLYERWRAGASGIEDGDGAAHRVRAHRAPVASRRRAAPTASRSSRMVAGDEALREAGWARRAALRPDARSAASSAPASAASARSSTATTCCCEHGPEDGLAAGGPADDGQRRRRPRVAMRHEPARPVATAIVSACAAGAHAIGAAAAHDPVRRRRRRRRPAAPRPR